MTSELHDERNAVTTDDVHFNQAATDAMLRTVEQACQMDDEREAFEARCQLVPLSIMKAPDGTYADKSVQAVWFGWQLCGEWEKSRQAQGVPVADDWDLREVIWPIIKTARANFSKHHIDFAQEIIDAVRPYLRTPIQHEAGKPDRGNADREDAMKDKQETPMSRMEISAFQEIAARAAMARPELEVAKKAASVSSQLLAELDAHAETKRRLAEAEAAKPAVPVDKDEPVARAIALQYSSCAADWMAFIKKGEAAIAALEAEQPARPAGDVVDKFMCNICRDRDVPEKYRVFGKCYKCASQATIAKRDRKIAGLKEELNLLAPAMAEAKAINILRTAYNNSDQWNFADERCLKTAHRELLKHADVTEKRE